MSTPPSTRASVGLILRSLLWTVLFPGLFAGYLPWRFFGLRDVQMQLDHPAHALGFAALLLGGALLAWCIWEFARRGRGTLSPADPPRRLVVQGLYRYVRNTMYLSVTAIVLREVALTGSGALLLYWALWFVAANFFVIGYEEPTLRRQFGDSYSEYTQRVGRWLPHRPRTGPGR